jgi:hypothetical protein
VEGGGIELQIIEPIQVDLPQSKIPMTGVVCHNIISTLFIFDLCMIIPSKTLSRLLNQLLKFTKTLVNKDSLSISFTILGGKKISLVSPD